MKKHEHIEHCRDLIREYGEALQKGNPVEVTFFAGEISAHLVGAREGHLVFRIGVAAQASHEGQQKTVIEQLGFLLAELDIVSTMNVGVN